MNESFYTNLRNSIVKQAVDDYVYSGKRIKCLLDNKQKTIIKIIKNGLELKKPKFYTYEEAEDEWKARIEKQKGIMIGVEMFFRSMWYKQMCDIDGEYIIAKTKEKTIRMCGVDLELLQL